MGVDGQKLKRSGGASSAVVATVGVVVHEPGVGLELAELGEALAWIPISSAGQQTVE